MIGVIANPEEHGTVREFFELFKTPWEFYRANRRYDVLLCAGDGEFARTARLVIFYAGKKTQFDDEQAIRTGGHLRHACTLSYHENRIPIYGNSITFPEKGSGLLTDGDSQVCAAYLEESGEGALARVGYDLFGEVRALLTDGQPTPNAEIPTLELHIEFLRDLIVGSGLSLVEIPPIPDGYRFTACLTHDVDHPSIRQHRWDYTAFGFLIRAVFGSLRKFLRGRMPLQDLLTNWAAAAKLPFIQLGLANDFWSGFDDRYLELEEGLRSTFFVIPYSGRRGRNSRGQAPKLRAAHYGAKDIAETVRKLNTRGCEVGLHGIDAWIDSSRGREEFEEIRQLTGASQIGVRMHWLYYNHQSPSNLEEVGSPYDSTIGYNETVGYRAGTTQVYKPLNASHLLELPLHVMDTALFYPSYLDLSTREAKAILGRMVDNAIQFGGTLTINWHDRSVAPERLWGACYRDLIEDLKSRGAWFATAGEATSWFRKRRSAAFESDSTELGEVRARVAVGRGDDLPGLRLRVRKARKPRAIDAHNCEDFVDIAIDEQADTPVANDAGR